MWQRPRKSWYNDASTRKQRARRPKQGQMPTAGRAVEKAASHHHSQASARQASAPNAVRPAAPLPPQPTGLGGQLGNAGSGCQRTIRNP
jgi:hypothetical protein